MINLLIIFAALILFAYLTNFLLVRSFLGFRWRFFVAPGVIIHELSHAFACVLMFAKVKKISFFDKDGGSVTHEKSKIPIIGPILISLAPLAVGIFLFFFLGRIIHLDGSLDTSAVVNNLKTIYCQIDFTNWRNILIVYLLLSIAVTMTPSWQDLINMLLPLVILAGSFYLLFRFTHLVNFSQYEPFVLHLTPILDLVVFVLAVCLAISFIFYLITWAVFQR
ncbi:MAG: hypothetical protein UT28_C0001G0929 [Berkelbacteria bacterium GW2011_GWE1_39_12]|uniref:Uncharacterized protein n=1 Tax=Berkelbacteria bacterium GW2011_GWE1_39_12 TaxID=1618337 RepID=A0A0G4B409_9BACT|nr:MAG: hypothetical protein UT28_C0001G0929 [Berkelbacteria bacterium GW2011_GWE1_39_12]